MSPESATGGVRGTSGGGDGGVPGSGAFPPVPSDLLEELRRRMERVRDTGAPEPTAVVLATAGADGRPHSRTVLLKGFDERGFVFYTNLRSRKGRQLAENPWASLTFYWPALAEQVQVAGRVEPVQDEEADAYWATRPRKSQLGAWASHQSETLESRRDLYRRFAELMAKHLGRAVPRPSHWSGFRVVPDRIELWRNRPRRLHERTVWEVRDGVWTTRMLNP
jgi:pyridoxamine 5'-phosphate oxidase